MGQFVKKTAYAYLENNLDCQNVRGDVSAKRQAKQACAEGLSAG